MISLACIFPDIADSGQLITKIPNGKPAPASLFASYLDNYISTVDPDVVTYDFYPYLGAGGHDTQGFYRNLEAFASRMNPLRGKKRAMWNVIGYGNGTGITPGVVPQADLLTIPQFDNEIYSAMAYGSKGIIYWRAEEEFFSGGVPLRYIVQDVMQQLPAATITHLTNVHASLINNGNELTSLNYAQAYHVASFCDTYAGCTYDIPVGSEWWRFSSNRFAARYFSSNPFVAQPGSSINPLLVSFLKHDNGDDYFWVVNKSMRTTSSFTMNFKMKTNIRQVLTNTINLGINSLAVTLQPGEGRLYHFYAPRIASGLNHTLAIKTNGTLWAWGQDESGQLGDGLQTASSTPKQIGSATDWVAVGAGVGYSIALKSNGTLWGWGSNQNGQLGNSNTGALQKTPAQIGTATDWRAISVGNLHTMALKRDGTLWGWGYNGEGELGAGFTNVAQTSPVQVQGLWSAVSAGSNHTVGIMYDGTLWSFGDNGSMQLGNNQTASSSSLPVREASYSTGWLAIAGGHRHTVALASDKTLWSWGENLYGQLGCGCSNSVRGFPTRFTNTSDAWSRIGTGNWHSGAVKSDGSLYLWGYNDVGQLGNNTLGPSNSPVRENLSAGNWVWFGGKIRQSFGVRSDGTLWAWGDNQGRQLAISTNLSYYTKPTQTLWKIFP
jgi:alpha-tubulin suppressor-like RCC1 family protein